MTIRSWAPLVAAAVLCALVLSWRAGAGAGVAGAPQTSVAVVNVERLLQNAEEYRERQEQLQRQASDLDAEFKQHREELRALGEELQELPTGSDARLQKVMEGLELQATLNARAEAWEAWLTREQSRLIKETFKKTERTVADIAARDGWDVVLWDHRGHPMLAMDGEVTESFEAMNRRIISQSIAHASPRADITQLVIDTMNNAYAVGR